MYKPIKLIFKLKKHKAVVNNPQRILQDSITIVESMMRVFII